MMRKLVSELAVFLHVLVGVAAGGLDGPASRAAEPAPAPIQADETAGGRRGSFLLEALVDFPDDALQAGFPLTPQHIDQMMARLAELGIRRVAWGYYGDGHGGYFMPEGFHEDYQGGWKHYADTCRQLGNPLKVAVEAGHRHALEVYAYFKPYETGPAVLFPEGTPQAHRWGRLEHLGGSLAWLDPFVVQNPTLRIARRSDDLPAQPAGAVRSIRLVKYDASPTRITKENHSTHTDWPEDYGFNPAVLSRCRGRPGTLADNIAEVRGEAYTEFLRKCKQRLEAAGKRMRYHLQVDFFRPSPPPARRLAYPANLRFDWPRWLDEELMDEAVLRVFSYPLTAVWDDPIAQQMVERCRQRNIPLTVNRYVSHGGAGLAGEVDRVYRDTRLSGFIFYETCDYLKFSASGECSLSSPIVAQATARVPKLAAPPKGQ